MIAQALLSILLCSVLVYAGVEYRRSPAVGLMAIGTSLAGLYFVWVPSHSTLVAEFVGVGRGADLILYLWVCISLIVLLNLHLKLRTQHESITKLARTIAIANAEAGLHAPRGFNGEQELHKAAAAAAAQYKSRKIHDQVS